MNRTVIVYGPMMCGKTRNRQALAAHFGVEKIVDDWDPSRSRLVDGALHLTQREHREPGAETHAFAVIKFNPAADAQAKLVHADPRKVYAPVVRRRPS